MNHVFDKTESLKKTLSYEILSGYYSAGGKLPSERVLSEKYNISRNTVRLTLDELEHMGIIIRNPRSGATVTACAPMILRNEKDPQVKLSVAWILPPDQISNPVVQSIFVVFKTYCPIGVQLSALFIDQLASENFENFKADMAILFAVPDDDIRKKIKKQIKHLILLNSVDENYDYIAPDNHLGGRMTAEYLLRNGHRKIGGVTFDDTSPGSDFKQRMDGCCEVFRENGIAFAPLCIPALRFNDFRYRRKLVLPAIKGDFSAFIAGCDIIAAELCAAASTERRCVPSDFSIIGFDDQFYTQYMLPPLTTVKYPTEAIAIHLANAVEELLKGNQIHLQKLIAPMLIERQSVCNIVLSNHVKK